MRETDRPENAIQPETTKKIFFRTREIAGLFTIQKAPFVHLMGDFIHKTRKKSAKREKSPLVYSEKSDIFVGFDYLPKNPVY
jgi:hypothetical protein